VHYPLAIPQQAAFQGAAGGPWPVAERVAAEVCSIPLNPSLTDDEQRRVIAAIQSWT
jgi:dTDP-4-amino-4,6-dideoxygalactose transaminase